MGEPQLGGRAHGIDVGQHLGPAAVERTGTPMRRLVIIPFLALLALPGLASAATAGTGPIRFARMSVKQGLSQSTVLCAFQDSRGFMWFGTEDGLNRLRRLHGHRVPPRPGGRGLAAQQLRAGPWPRTPRATCGWHRRRRDRPVGGRHRPLPVVPPACGRARRAGQRPRAHAARGPRRPGLGRHPRPGAGPSRPAHRQGHALPQRPRRPEQPQRRQRSPRCCEDHAGALWIGTNGGLNRLDAPTGRFRRYRADAADAASLADDQVRSLAEDTTGTLWVGTQAGGLHRSWPARKLPALLRSDPADPRSLSTTACGRWSGRRGPPVGRHPGGLEPARQPPWRVRALPQRSRRPDAASATTT